MSKYRDSFREVEQEGYWSLPRVLMGGLVMLVVLYGIGFLATGGDLAIYKFWAPKQENAKRQVFENTQSYVEGKVQNIEQECFAYNKADGAQKDSLAGEIRNEATTIDLDKLPAVERSCVSEARGQC
jgi:hypothetical protein